MALLAAINAYFITMGGVFPNFRHFFGIGVGAAAIILILKIMRAYIAGKIFISPACRLLLAAAVLASVGPAREAGAQGAGGYDIEASVVDSGGGQQLSGGAYSSRGAIAQASMPENGGSLAGGDYVNRAGFYNPPHFTFQKGLTAALNTPSGDVRVTLPPGAVDKDRFDITMNRDPLAQPTAVDPGKINEATDKIVHNDGPWSQLMAGNMSEMAIFDEQDFYTKPLAKRGTLTMAYRDADNDGILDGSNPPVRVETINAWLLDESVNAWVRLNDAGVDPAAKTVSVYFGTPGVYAMFGALADSVRDVKAYPVPFRPYGAQAGTGVGQTGTEVQGITFDNVPQVGNIEIYTLDGRLVRKIAIPETFGAAKVAWDVKTAGGQRAASGVYIWRVVSGSNVKTGKLMVIW